MSKRLTSFASERWGFRVNRAPPRTIQHRDAGEEPKVKRYKAFCRRSFVAYLAQA